MLHKRGFNQSDYIEAGLWEEQTIASLSDYSVFVLIWMKYFTRDQESEEKDLCTPFTCSHGGKLYRTLDGPLECHATLWDPRIRGNGWRHKPVTAAARWLVVFPDSCLSRLQDLNTKIIKSERLKCSSVFVFTQNSPVRWGVNEMMSHSVSFGPFPSKCLSAPRPGLSPQMG